MWMRRVCDASADHRPCPFCVRKPEQIDVAVWHACWMCRLCWFEFLLYILVLTFPIVNWTAFAQVHVHVDDFILKFSSNVSFDVFPMYARLVWWWCTDAFCGAKVDMEGLTGRMKFYEGRRTEFELDILQLSDGGLSKVRRNTTTTR